VKRDKKNRKKRSMPTIAVTPSVAINYARRGKDIFKTAIDRDSNFLFATVLQMPVYRFIIAWRLAKHDKLTVF
jgi:hypothetical protein